MNIDSIEVKNNVVLTNNDNDNVLSYYMTDITSEKKFNSVIKEVEKSVRTSKRYTEYVKYLKETVGLTSCAVLPNMSSSGNSGISVEFHHYPFTLYDIVKLVIINNMINRNSFSTFTITKEVIGLHLNNLVGMVPLTTTIHQLYDVDGFSISKDMFFGDVHSFIELYKMSFSKEMVTKYNKLISKDSNFSMIQHSKGGSDG